MSARTIERVTPGERLADFCLWDYPPQAPPIGKLRSSTLLWTFLEIVGAHGLVRDCCETLRRVLGPFQTVWGIKERGGAFSFEFYFYDYGRLERSVSATRVLAALSGHLHSDLIVPERRPYFMFSLDIDDGVVASRRLDSLSLYLGNPSASVSSGICYELTRETTRLANVYYFYDRAKELDDIQAKVACSAHLDLRAFDMNKILWPEMLDCGIVVVANKKFNDGIYFARLPLDGFRRFLRKVAFPAPFADFIDDHRAELDHLLFDVGIDYHLHNKDISISKSAIYGLL